MAHVLVTGASGFVGARVVEALLDAGHAVTAAWHSHEERVPAARGGLETVRLDLAEEESVEAAFRAAWPEAVVHAGAIADLKACEVDPERARRVNVDASAKLARLCVAFGARLVFLSTDQVFDGGGGPYAEEAEARPLHVYGRTKLAAEEAVLTAHPGACVLRLALVYGDSPSGDRSASEKIVNALRAGERPRLFTDEIRTPVLVDDVVAAVGAALAGGLPPRLHVGGPERVSRHELGLRVAAAYGLDPTPIEPVALDALRLDPPRPRDVSFDTRRAQALLKQPPRTLEEGLRAIAAR